MNRSASPRTLTWVVFVGSLLVALGLCWFLPPSGSPGPKGKQVESKALPPLESELLVELSSGKEVAAWVAVPRGATSARPLHVVFPEEGDTRERCRSFAELVGARGFVLCPTLPEINADPSAGARGPVVGGQGVSRERVDGRKATPKAESVGDEALRLDSPLATLVSIEARLRQALAMTKKRFGDYLDSGSVSLSASGAPAERAVWLVQSSPKFFARVLLLNGGYKSWSPVQVQHFAERGGKRLVFGCAPKEGGSECLTQAGLRTVLSRRAGVEATVSEVAMPSTGVPPKELFVWLINGDPRYQAH